MSYREVATCFSLSLVAFYLAVAIFLSTPADAMAPNFFSHRPKSLPPIGKRSTYIPLEMEEDTPRGMTRRLIRTLTQVMPILDKNGDGALSPEEFSEAPLVSMALEAGRKEFLVPQDERHVNMLDIF